MCGSALGFTGTDEDVAELRKFDARWIAFALDANSREGKIRMTGFSGMGTFEEGCGINLQA